MPDITSRVRWWQFLISIVVAGALAGLIGRRFDDPTIGAFVSSFLGITISIIYLRSAQRKN